MPKDKITFPELDAMSMRADEAHMPLDTLAHQAFDAWQSELPEEFRMQYVPLWGEGFEAGIAYAKRLLLSGNLDGVRDWLDSERDGSASHGYEAIGVVGLSRIWEAAQVDAARRLMAARAYLEDKADSFWCEAVMTPLPRPDLVAYRYGEITWHQFDVTTNVHLAEQVGVRQMRIWRDVECGEVKWEWVK